MHTPQINRSVPKKNMLSCASRLNILFRTIIIGVVSLFLINDVALAFSLQISNPQKSALAPPLATKPQTTQQPKPEWVGVIKVVGTEPQGDKQIRFLPENYGAFAIVKKVRYRGKTYWAKYFWELEDENCFIIPQAEILCYLNTLNLNGISKAVYFLELDTDKKVILFEDFPPGETLSEKIKRMEEIPEKEAVSIMLKVADIFRRLHEAGVYHWDIKPDNIWITNENEVIIFDFDVAFRTKKEFVEKRRFIASTPSYESSNRRRWIEDGFYNESGDFPPISDEVYSLGMTLLHMLRGISERGLVTPQRYANRQLTLLKERHEITFEEQVFLLGVLDDSNMLEYKYKISPELKRILYKALYDGKSDYKTVDEFLQDLADYFEIKK